MSTLSHPNSNIPLLIQFGIILVARHFMTCLGLPGLPKINVKQLLDVTGVSASQAYQWRKWILDWLQHLERPTGRPPKPVVAPRGETEGLTHKVLQHVTVHPGCLKSGEPRNSYSKGFRRFIMELYYEHADLDPSVFADAVLVPLGTMNFWLHGARSLEAEAKTSEPPNEVSAPEDPKREVRSLRLETLQKEWLCWEGSFGDFCNHAQNHLHIPWGRTLIGNVLEQLGVRHRKRRPGRSPDEKALCGTFESFFAGAQWQGDGSPIKVDINEKTFTFNLELMIDSHTDAFCGVSVREAEDSAAVVEAFQNGVQTTKAAPQALLLDSRPSNHTEEVKKVTDHTIILQGTLGRAQSRPHVEGGFGLFAQTVPDRIFSLRQPSNLGSAAPRVCFYHVRTYSKPQKTRTPSVEIS